jgi:hypothetical protein
MLLKRMRLRRQTRSIPRRRSTKTSRASTASINRARIRSSANLRSPLRHRRHRPSSHRAKAKVKVNNPDTHTRPSSGAHGPRRPHDQAMADGVIEDPPSEDSRIPGSQDYTLLAYALAPSLFIARYLRPCKHRAEPNRNMCMVAHAPASRHAPSSVISSFRHFVIRRTFPVRVQAFESYISLHQPTPYDIIDPSLSSRPPPLLVSSVVVPSFLITVRFHFPIHHVILHGQTITFITFGSHTYIHT